MLSASTLMQDEEEDDTGEDVNGDGDFNTFVEVK
jgi:hypothetical protein